IDAVLGEQFGECAAVALLDGVAEGAEHGCGVHGVVSRDDGLSSPLPLWERVDRMSVSSFETGEGSVSAEKTPHPAPRATFSHKGRRKKEKTHPISATAAMIRAISCGRDRRWSPSWIMVSTTSSAGSRWASAKACCQGTSGSCAPCRIRTGHPTSMALP